MAIRWVSTPESIKANQPSWLAIAETLAAMGASVWIAVTWDTYVHIAIGAMIAPLLLMRTDESCIRARKYSGWIGKNVPKPPDYHSHPFRDMLWQFLFLIGVAVIPPATRFAAWFVTLLQSPVASIGAIPENWRHAAVALDSRQWPHALHPPNRIPDGWKDSDFPTIRDIFLEIFDALVARDPGDRDDFFVAMCVGMFVLLSIPAFAYRWSIKSTAIIWFPLLWAMHSTKSAAGRLQPCLDIYRRDPVTKIVLGVSVAAVAGFIIKLVLHNEWAGFAEWWNEGPLREFLSLYVAPAEIPRWQLAIAINSGIAFLMYILAGHWLVRLEYKRLTDETWPRRIFQTGLFIRPILSCYTIACTLYITSIAAWNLPWPALGEQWFPWQ